VPIALLLEEATLAFRFGAKQLSPWIHLVAVEELLIDRARSAFLVRWFGTNLPLNSFHLKVVIDNLEQLRDRYLLAKESAKGNLIGPNLTEPLAGLTGELIGYLTSPTGMILLAVGFTRKAHRFVATAGRVLLALVAAAIGPVIGPPVVLGILGYKAGKNVQTSEPMVDMFGALARVLDAARQFVDVLLGPREQVRNPLLIQLLGLLDRVAGLAPQLLGLLAFVVVRLGPLLVPLAAQVVAFQSLFKESFATLKFIIDDLIARLGDLLGPKTLPTRVIGLVFEQLALLMPALMISFTEFFVSAKSILDDFSKRARPAFENYLKTIGTWLKGAFTNHPLKVILDNAKVAARVARDALTDKSAPPSPSTFPSVPKLAITEPKTVISLLGAEPPGLRDVKPLAQLLLEAQRFRVQLPLSREALAELDRARNPPSVFAGERQALIKSLGGRAPKTALADELATQQRLRDLLTEVVGRVLPPELHVHMGKLLGGFQSIDQKLSLDPKTTKQLEDFKYPVRDLKDNGQLRPVMHRLIVCAKGATRLAVQDFEDRLQRKLTQQSYPAPFGP
jgi:hypothetical protein